MGFVETVFEYQPIRPWHLQNILQLNNKTFDTWYKRLIDLNILTKNGDGLVCLSESAREQYEKGIPLIPQDIRKRIPNYGVKRNDKSEGKRIAASKRLNNEKSRLGYTILAIAAAFGNQHYTRVDDTTILAGLMMRDISGREVHFTPIEYPGVGISDFFKKEKEGIQSTPDQRTFVGFSELLSHLNFTEQEIIQYIDHLRNHYKPVLREMTIPDHAFCSYVYDMNRPNLDTLTREDYFADNPIQPVIRLSPNDGDDSRSQFCHDIYCYHDSNNKIEVYSKFVFDINNQSTQRFLEIDSYYGENNFSLPWKEKRYVIANTLLMEFIETCTFLLGSVIRRMEYTYVHRLWPKSPEGTSIRKRYLRWHTYLYGVHRVTAETFLWFRERKTDLKKLNKKVHYNIQEKVRYEINSLDKQIKCDCERLQNERFRQIQEQYSIVTKPLLEISYPDFIKDLYKIGRKTFTSEDGGSH